MDGGHWVLTGSNRWLSRCKRDALPSELSTLEVKDFEEKNFENSSGWIPIPEGIHGSLILKDSYP